MNSFSLLLVLCSSAANAVPTFFHTYGPPGYGPGVLPSQYFYDNPYYYLWNPSFGPYFGYRGQQYQNGYPVGFIRTAQGGVQPAQGSSGAAFAPVVRQAEPVGAAPTPDAAAGAPANPTGAAAPPATGAPANDGAGDPADTTEDGVDDGDDQSDGNFASNEATEPASIAAPVSGSPSPPAETVSRVPVADQSPSSDSADPSQPDPNSGADSGDEPSSDGNSEDSVDAPETQDSGDSQDSPVDAQDEQAAQPDQESNLTKRAEAESDGFVEKFIAEARALIKKPVAKDS